MQIVEITRKLGQANLLIKVSYVVMLGIIGSSMLLENLESLKKKTRPGKATETSRNPHSHLRINRFLPCQR